MAITRLIFRRMKHPTTIAVLCDDSSSLARFLIRIEHRYLPSNIWGSWSAASLAGSKDHVLDPRVM
jgi:hypothetical protein